MDGRNDFILEPNGQLFVNSQEMADKLVEAIRTHQFKQPGFDPIKIIINPVVPPNEVWAINPSKLQPAWHQPEDLL